MASPVSPPPSGAAPATSVPPTTATANGEARPDRPRGTAFGRRSMITARVALGLTALLIIVQSVTAGGFLQGRYGFLDTHSANAGILALVLLVGLIAAILAWRPGRVPGAGGTAVRAAVMMVLVPVEMILGYSRVLIVHIPLALLLLIGAVTAAQQAAVPQRRRKEKKSGAEARS
ncbi:hypothetical protein BIV57_06420 [Mangrovactinospora gilvigrisea]|uniref:Integral membrane protein n=1 Tax=Mangrovactinospora gilvigrisea TaxID=1428644 RepID=A0A1J7BHZ8_9ACTN|nr:hypothetical protein [Mangrovactinospora gilvigrisea]OIV38295.1 hypothetical protein BIV57_06420 [Mangrovactinospora gilvigrisea]